MEDPMSSNGSARHVDVVVKNGTYYNIKMVTYQAAFFKPLLVAAAVFLYYWFISSKGITYLIVLSSVDLIPPLFVIHALRTSKAAFLIPYMIYLIVNIMKNIAITTFSIYGLFNPDEYHNIFCSLYSCDPVYKSSEETVIRIYLGSIAAFLFVDICATFWFFVITRKCYKFARLQVRIKAHAIVISPTHLQPPVFVPQQMFNGNPQWIRFLKVTVLLMAVFQATFFGAANVYVLGSSVAAPPSSHEQAAQGLFLIYSAAFEMLPAMFNYVALRKHNELYFTPFLIISYLQVLPGLAIALFTNFALVYPLNGFKQYQKFCETLLCDASDPQVMYATLKYACLLCVANTVVRLLAAAIVAELGYQIRLQKRRRYHLLFSK
ncbi:hypothetical protein QR680_000479 [Steinernema hermaphroditum]|uniref:Uncharacterized protein n=1 Tax=Steinernema hermaphroditum TaxID=289476 RepID=A0AA39LE90_9BILA|nr:hypothetical protein QR680_000479 [Steinernema hermaphroditum]